MQARTYVLQIVAKFRMPQVKLTDAFLRKKEPPSGIAIEYWDQALPGFGVRFNPSGRKAFMCMTRVKGKQRRFAVGSYPALSLAEARNKARQVCESASAGIDPRERQALEDAAREAEHRRAMRIQLTTFGGIVDLFLEEHAKGLRSYEQLRRMVENELRPLWADSPMEEISRVEIKALLQRIAKRAPTMANRYHALISKVFNWALEEELIDKSPMVRLRKLTPERQRERVLSYDEIGRLWPAFEGLGYPYGPLFQFMLLTAQRRSECGGLRWSEIDLKAKEWRLPPERTKSGKGHLIPLSKLALKIIKSIPQDSPFVFTTTGDRPVNGYSKPKRAVSEASGVTDWTLHDLRRTAATHMRGLGADRLTISKILNHAESGITGIYDRHAYDKEKRIALEKWSKQMPSRTRRNGMTEM